MGSMFLRKTEYSDLGRETLQAGLGWRNSDRARLCRLASQQQLCCRAPRPTRRCWPRTPRTPRSPPASDHAPERPRRNPRGPGRPAAFRRSVVAQQRVHLRRGMALVVSASCALCGSRPAARPAAPSRGPRPLPLWSSSRLMLHEACPGTRAVERQGWAVHFA